MANLKDTIVLGNLTVTGSVVASDILVSGTGNEFDSIKVNKIMAKDQNNVYLEYGRDSGDGAAYYGWKTAGSDTYGFIFPSTTNTGGIGTDSNVYKKGYFQGLYTEGINPAPGKTSIEMCNIDNETDLTISTTGFLTLNSQQVNPSQSANGYASYLGGPARCWDWIFSNYLTTNYVYAAAIVPRYTGTSTDSTTNARDKTGSIGTAQNTWFSAYINKICMKNGVIIGGHGIGNQLTQSSSMQIYIPLHDGTTWANGSGISYTHYGPSGTYTWKVNALSNWAVGMAGNSTLTTTTVTFGFAGKTLTQSMSLTYNYSGDMYYYSGNTVAKNTTVTLEYGKTYTLTVSCTATQIRRTINMSSVYIYPSSITEGEGTIALCPTGSIYGGQTQIGGQSSAGIDIVIGAGGKTYCSMSSPTTSWTFTSDKRDKADIEQLKTSLSFIKQLQPITYVDNMREYYYNDDGSFNQESYERQVLKKHRRHAGFLAQDVYDLIKKEYNTDNYASVVSYNKYNHISDKEIDRYSFNSSQLIPFLVKAIQEQQEIIDKLQTRIVKLEQGDK